MSILGGNGIVEALSQVVSAEDFPYPDERAFILLAEMEALQPEDVHPDALNLPELIMRR